jgi:hypothetical protein
MRNPDLAFNLNQRVFVIDAEIYATVQAILLNCDGIQFQICYWHEGSRRVEWVFSREIKAVKKDVIA